MDVDDGGGVRRSKSQRSPWQAKDGRRRRAEGQEEATEKSKEAKEGEEREGRPRPRGTSPVTGPATRRDRGSVRVAHLKVEP